MSLGSMEQRTAGMKKQAQELIEQAYQRGYKAGREDGYEDWKKSVFNDITIDVKSFIEQGRNEALEAVKKLYLPTDDGGLPGSEIKKIFDELSWYSIIVKHSASEIVEKLRAYEEQKKQEENSEIHVGDEVEFVGTDTKGVVISTGTTHPHVLVSDYITQCHIGDLMPTGRHFPELIELLKKLKEK